MALYLPTKGPADTIAYSWSPALAPGDSVDTASLDVVSGTVIIGGYENHGDTIALSLSGGADHETTVIDALVITALGETLAETIYITVSTDGNALENTARAVCQYALRKINGNGNDADADQLEDAMERLNDLLASWAGQGANLGVALPLTSTDTLYIPDEFLQAVKANLHLELIEHYGQQPGQRVVMNAARGLQLIKAALLSDDRGAAVYF